jgi:hypothetical protein
VITEIVRSQRQALIERQILDALAAAVTCLLEIGSDWLNKEGHTRQRALDCAHEGMKVLRRARRRF